MSSTLGRCPPSCCHTRVRLLFYLHDLAPRAAPDHGPLTAPHPCRRSYAYGSPRRRCWARNLPCRRNHSHHGCASPPVHHNSGGHFGCSPTRTEVGAGEARFFSSISSKWLQSVRFVEIHGWSSLLRWCLVGGVAKQLKEPPQEPLGCIYRKIRCDKKS